MTRTETFIPKALRGGRSTEALDLSDADDAFHHFVEVTEGDRQAAAILAAGTMIAEAIRDQTP